MIISIIPIFILNKATLMKLMSYHYRRRDSTQLYVSMYWNISRNIKTPLRDSMII